MCANGFDDGVYMVIMRVDISLSSTVALGFREWLSRNNYVVFDLFNELIAVSGTSCPSQTVDAALTYCAGHDKIDAKIVSCSTLLRCTLRHTHTQTQTQTHPALATCSAQ